METKERILLKADELFRRFGIRAVTLDDIANNLAISKKTIYQYFEDKDALVDEVMIIEFEKNNNECIHCSDNAKDAVEEIFLLMEHLDKDFRNMNPIILHDLKKFHHKTFIKFNEFMHENLIKMIASNLQRGVNEGFYRDNFDIETIARYRMASVWLLFDQEIFPANKFDLVKTSHQLMEMFLYGIINPKGYKLIEKYKQA